MPRWVSAGTPSSCATTSSILAVIAGMVACWSTSLASQKLCRLRRICGLAAGSNFQWSDSRQANVEACLKA
jgi:hypothetical protein